MYVHPNGISSVTRQTLLFVVIIAVRFVVGYGGGNHALCRMEALPWNWWIYSTHSPLSCLQGGEGGGGFGHAQLR